MSTAEPDPRPKDDEPVIEQQPEVDQIEPNRSPVARPKSKSPRRPRRTRTYTELKAEFKKGRGLTMTKVESEIYWKGKRDDWEAERERHEVAAERFWTFSKSLTSHVAVKCLFYTVYGVWTATPIVGIFIGLIYVQSDNCPGQPSIAPLLIALGLLSIVVGISLVSSKKPVVDPEQTPYPNLGVEPKDEIEPELPLNNGGNTVHAPLSDQESDIEPGPNSETYTFSETLGVCAGGFLFCSIVIFKFAHLILFIATSVIVYRFAGRVQFSKASLSEEEVQSVYCNEVLFRFAYWSITLALVILGVLLLCCSFGCCTFVAWTSYAARETQHANTPATEP